MKKHYFEGFFKGGRDYLHGTDLFNHANSLAKESIDESAYIISFTIRSVARNQGEFFLGEDALPEGMTKTAHFKIASPLEVYKGFFATNCKEVVVKKDYDEDLVMQDAEIDEQTKKIVQFSKTSFSAIEEIVALTKFLHNRTLKPMQGQWMFTMLELKQPLSLREDSLFEVCLKQNLGGKMTRSSVFKGGEQIGTIGFTVL